MKIDTEGNELDILKGASESLKKGVIRNIQIEVHQTLMRSNNSKGVEQFLIEHGYIFKKHLNICLEIFLKNLLLKITTWMCMEHHS